MIRVLIVDSVRFVGEATAAILDEEPDIEVIGWSRTTEDAMAQLDGCDVVVVNAGLSNSGALKLTRAIIDRGCAAKVLVCGLAETQPTIMRYVEAGAAGYVLGEAAVDNLLETIRAAHDGRAVISPRIAAALMERIAELSVSVNPTWTGPDEGADLTPREEEVLDLIGYGYTNQEIAERLTIAVGTVKNHVHNILSKLDAGDRHEATAYYSQMNGRSAQEAI